MKTTDTPRSGMRMPHWRWFALGTTLLVAGTVALSICLAYYRERQIVQKLERLDNFYVDYVTPAGIAWLEPLLGDKLTAAFGRVDFVLAYNQITDDDLPQLTGLTKLRDLSLCVTNVSDSGLDRLNGLTNLNELNLSGTAVTDTGMVHLARLKNLGALDLSDTRVTDAGLVHLRRLPKLWFLDLSGTAVTDAGIVYLAQLTNLRLVHLGKTSVSDAAVEKLRNELPDCDVDRM